MASQIVRRMLPNRAMEIFANPKNFGARVFNQSFSLALSNYNLKRATLFLGNGINKIVESIKRIFKTVDVPIEWEEHNVA
ncbi:unnamed protein product, partial [Ilex paraguariensis]